MREGQIVKWVATGQFAFLIGSLSKMAARWARHEANAARVTISAGSLLLSASWRALPISIALNTSVSPIETYGSSLAGQPSILSGD